MPCTSTAVARGWPEAGHERVTSSTPSLVLSLLMLRRRLQAQDGALGRGCGYDRNVVIAEGRLEPDRRESDRTADEAPADDRLRSDERPDIGVHQQGDGDDGVGQVDEGPQQRDAD